MAASTDTKEALIDAFIELGSTKPLDKITIGEITDKAGVIRSTFYNHFHDKYEVIEAVIRDRLLGRVDVLIENGMLYETIVVIGRNILPNKEFYKNAGKLKGQNSFESIVEECVVDIVMEFFMKNPEVHHARNPWITPRRIAGFYAHIMTYIFMLWIEADMAVSPENMAEIYKYLEGKSLIDAFRDMGVDTEEWVWKQDKLK